MELPPAGGVLASALGGIGVFLVTRAVLDRPFRSRRVARLRRITPVERPLIGEERQEAPLFRTPLLEELVGQPLRRAG